mgnify:CR=1 FL=1
MSYIQVNQKQTIQRKPAFHIEEPNRLRGNKVQILLNPLMAQALCTKLENLELEPDEEYIYAFAKHIRRYYRKTKTHPQESGHKASSEIFV